MIQKRKSDLPEQYRHDLEVIRNTAKQIIKDFGFWGIQIQFSGNESAAYEELRTQLFPALRKFYSENQGGFFSLLYRIDVLESEVQKLYDTYQGDIFIKALADLVIEREFIKVITRKLFSSGNG